ncbi:MAG TPA: transcription antitermination factor NusB [Cytophagales bacterium]|nr:transcription antitermination factor NusB [Cytophagales bacterium]
MQTIYAFLQCKKSDYHVAMGLIEEKLTPGFEVMELPPQSVIDENKKIASTYFEQYFNKEINAISKEEKSEARDAASDSIALYNNLVRKDLDFFTKNMVMELEKVENIYLLLLLLPFQIAKTAEQNDSKQEQKYIKKNAPFGKNLNNNRFIQALAENEALNKESGKKNIGWGNFSEKINEWYLEIVKKDEEFIKYSELTDPDPEEDKKILAHLFKNIIFKVKTFETYFEELGVRWEEDKEILKGMITKTIKSLSENNNEYELELFTKEEDWDEEKEFFVSLFKNTILKEEELEQSISGKAANWDIERIALLDKIIIKMALTEMITFPGIPIKVTINEYLEIAKRYSTPKSRQFINGLLDSISNELLAKGIIKKSGRGLIDNK